MIASGNQLVASHFLRPQQLTLEYVGKKNSPDQNRLFYIRTCYDDDDDDDEGGGGSEMLLLLMMMIMMMVKMMLMLLLMMLLLLS